MNFNLNQIPHRIPKPRKYGLTMVMDKGLCLEEARNLISAAGPHIDLIKLGFGTAFVTPNLREKIELYQSAGIPVYFGGTLFEAFLIRNQFNDYIALCEDFHITHMEVSDGSITIPHTEKCGYIEKLTKHGTVLSEVGSKEAGILISPNKWKQMMHDELQAGMVNHASRPRFSPRMSYRSARPMTRNATATVNGRRRSRRSIIGRQNTSARTTSVHTSTSTNHSRPAVILSCGPRNLLASSRFVHV